MRWRIVMARRIVRSRRSCCASGRGSAESARNSRRAARQRSESMVQARTVALAVGLLVVALPASATALDEACTRQAYDGADRIVTTPKPSGYQVTAVYGDGVYRASRCDKT